MKNSKIVTLFSMHTFFDVGRKPCTCLSTKSVVSDIFFFVIVGNEVEPFKMNSLTFFKILENSENSHLRNLEISKLNSITTRLAESC